MGNTTSWKEEVLLHDGKKIIVERSTTVDPKGNREIGQPAPKSEETLRFSLPGGSQSITWKSDFGQDLQDNLDLLALDIVDGKPYIVTQPSRCHAFNKWGRPNPPYVLLKFDGQVWQRIALSDLPKEIKKANVVIGGYVEQEDRLRGMGIDVSKTKPYLQAEVVDRFNQDMGGDPGILLMQVFTREPLTGGGMNCAESVYYKGAWVGPGDSIGRQIMDGKPVKSQ
jgi:hypothetical protein